LEDPGSLALELLLADGEERSLHAAMMHLSGLEFEILSRRYGVSACETDGKTPETLREIGASHNLSRERIRQIQQNALDKLRRHYRRSHE
jgi:DNA-directed RNA polymerase sigma subunit (sigma70/sigma32)